MPGLPIAGQNARSQVTDATKAPGFFANAYAFGEKKLLYTLALFESIVLVIFQNFML